jgi:tetratricopeptide (TPR) repeat protein
MKKIDVNFLEPSKQQLNDLLEYYQTGRYEDAEKLSVSITEEFPKHQFAWKVLGAALKQIGKINESLVATQKSVQLDPQDIEAHNNLAILLQELGRLDEAEISYRKAITLKPDLVKAHLNLGNTLQGLGRLDEAEASYRKAITLKPDYVEAHYNLGITLKELGKLDEAEVSYRKAITLKPDLVEAHHNLDFLLKRKELLVNISQAKKDEIKNNLKSANVNSVSSNLRLSPNPFISKREVERELFTDLYKMKTRELNKTKDARYGNGRCSDFKFLENELPIIKNIAEDLKKIMMQAVKSEIFIIDSFLNIYGANSGTTPHNHIDYFDKSQGLVNQKYSLTYYLSVGDQNCSEPGNLKVYDPEEEILVSEGKIVILPSSRKHAAIYNGKKDRIMVGVNFYSLL